MNILKLLLINYLLINTVNVLAGQEAGNGGDVVYCETSNGATVELLDIYEARVIHLLNVEPINNGITYIDFAKKQIDKLSKWRHQSRYNQRINDFTERITWSSKELVDIPDSFHVSIPKGCVVRQLAINHLNGRITINEN